MKIDKQQKAPLLEALKKHAQQEIISFHMPGHKGGKGIDRELGEWLGKGTLSIDLTEVPGTDDLHRPESVIKEAQELAAEAFGAEHSFFLVNGTSSGIQAMLLAVCRPGDKIIVPRNVHRSILGGIIMAGAWPVYIRPEIDENLGIALGVTPQRVDEALKAHPDAQGVLLVNPTYYGVSADLEKIVQLVHGYGKPLLVDEAHGPHLKFHSDLPLSALEAGADLCAQGIHKIIGGMTQASMLHLQGSRVDLARVKNALRMVQTTSPSYVLMASLDGARRQMALEGRGLLEKTIKLAQKAREKINNLAGFSCLGAEVIGRPGAYQLDLTKLAVSCQETGFTGQQVEALLREKYRIQPELSAHNHLLFICTIGDEEKELEMLLRALQEISQQGKEQPSLNNTINYWTIIPEQVLAPREAFFAEKEIIPIEAALGRISGEMIAPYPPGIPVLAPGEKIDLNLLACLLDIKKKGLKVQGPEDYSLETLTVVK